MHTNTELTDGWSLHKILGWSHFKQLSEDNVPVAEDASPPIVSQT